MEQTSTLTGSTPSNAINMVAFTQDNNAFDASNSIQCIGRCESGHYYAVNCDALYKKPGGSFSLAHEVILDDGSIRQVKCKNIDTVEALNWLLNEHPAGQVIINQHFSEFIKENEMEEFIMNWYAPPAFDQFNSSRVNAST